MDSLTQIVLGAAVAEAIGGRQMGNKAAMWGAIAGTIPDLDVFIRAMAHPIDGELLHRGFSHSIVFALLAAPVLGWLIHRLYKRRYEQKTWIWLFFGSIITHPMLDMFTNYGTQFFWPFDWRVSFNSVFVIDPLYTLPFGILLLVALFLKRDSSLRRKLNRIGIIYSSFYLLWCLTVKLIILNKSDDYFAQAGIKGENTVVTPMPFTSFYWMLLTEDDEHFYVGYKSILYPFKPNDINVVPKNRNLIQHFEWSQFDYKTKLKHISQGYYALEQVGDTIHFYDMRFGLSSKFTAEKIHQPIKGFGMVIDKGLVKKTFQLHRTDVWKEVNFSFYFTKVFEK
jgi:inner membrane protein